MKTAEGLASNRPANCEGVTGPISNRCLKKNTLIAWNVTYADDLFLEGYKIRNVNAHKTHARIHTNAHIAEHTLQARTDAYVRVCACTYEHRYTRQCMHTHTHTHTHTTHTHTHTHRAHTHAHKQ